MIVVSAAYTDNLGPEADIAGLLVKAAAKLAGTLADELVLVVGRPFTDFALSPAGFASILLRVEAPAGVVAALNAGPLAELADLADAHFSELYPRRSIGLSVALDVLGREALIERRHAAPPSEETF
jgi:hypothetical protein